VDISHFESVLDEFLEKKSKEKVPLSALNDIKSEIPRPKVCAICFRHFENY